MTFREMGMCSILLVKGSDAKNCVESSQDPSWRLVWTAGIPA